MKNAKAHSLRTQQAIALFGKAARHPLCLAALDLWRMETELSKWSQAVVLSEQAVNRAKQRRRKVLALIEQFRDEQKEKEVKKACALFREIDKHLLEAQNYYQAAVKLRPIFQELHGMAVTQFNREHDAAIHRGGRKALLALQRTRRRWNNKRQFLGDSDR